MALVQSPFLSMNATGSVGGITCSRNTSGVICRAKITPMKKKHIETSRIRRVHWCPITEVWGYLGEPKRSQYEQLATNLKSTNRLGDTSELTAFNWFMKFKFSKNVWYGPTIGVTPRTQVPFSNPDFSISISGSQFFLNSIGSPIADSVVIIWTQRNLLLSQRRPKLKHFAYKFGLTGTFPFAISPVFDTVGGPGDLPPVISGYWNAFWVKVVTAFGQQSPTLFFLQQAI